MENIEIYFESIKQVYNQILDWEKEKENPPVPLWRRIIVFVGVSSIFIFILCLIPIIPSLLVFIGGRFSWTIWGFNLSQATIWTYCLAWLISVFISLIFFLLNLWIDGKTTPKEDKEKAPQTLSAEQLTFIFIYQAYKELKIFFVSHIDQHIEKALASLKELRTSETSFLLDDDVELSQLSEEIRYREMRERTLASTINLRRRKNRSSLPRQIFVAQEFLKTFEKYPWFHIDDLTKARLQAIISFQKKIIVRLKKREDLPAVLTVLENLSKFLYAFLPEHQTNMSQDELKVLQAEGSKCLDKFVEDTNKLIDYPSEQRQDKNGKAHEILTFSQQIQIVYLSNIFFRFIVWLLLLLATTTGLIYLVSLKITNLDINIMISTIITASVAGATALAVIGNKPQSLQELKNESVKRLKNLTDDQDAS